MNVWLLAVVILSAGLAVGGCWLRSRRLIWFLSRINSIRERESEVMREDCRFLLNERAMLQDRLLKERWQRLEQERTIEALRTRLGKQDQMRRAMFNIVNDMEIARQEAVSSSIIKGQFLANMSHEIRTPLNGIIGMNQLLQSTSLDEEQRDFVDTGLDAADTLLGIVNDILDFSKLEAGAVALDAHDFDLLKVVDEVIATLSGRAVEKGIDLHADISASVPTLLVGDSFRIKQILLNLTNNAVRFTDEGEVLIRVSITAREAEDLILRFAVVDSGIGISREQQSSLFKPFSQVDGSTTRKYGGTGLGLVIAKNLVEAMSGAIDFRSEPGKGSEFWFELPLSKQSRGSKMPFAMPRELMSRQFLILDDSNRRRESLANALREWGCRHTDGMGSQEFRTRLGKAKSETWDWDFLIVDSRLEWNDGKPLAARVRTLVPGWNPKILVICKWGAEVQWRAKIPDTVDGILTIPIRQQSLVNRLAEFCDRPAQAAAPAEESGVEKLGDDPHVLVVEDNRVNQKVVEKLLHKMGCRVSCVGDGLKALETVTSGHFDLILMDYQMPVMNGCDATKHIRRLEGEVSRIPIIGLTANAIQCDREKALASGMDDYLYKPVVFADLKKAVVRQLGRATENSGTD